MLSAWQHQIGSLYNLCLRDRIDSYYQTKIQGAFCDLKTKGEACPLTCSVVKSASLGDPWKTGDPKKRRGKDLGKPRSLKRSAYEMNASLATQWRQTKPWYRTVNADVLQQSLRHLDRAFNGFFKLGRGFPRFKPHRDVGIEFKPQTVRVNGYCLTFPTLGIMRFFNSRPIEDNWEMRTATITRQVDGWYVSILIRDDSIPAVPAVENPKTVVGVDVGIKKLASCSDGDLIPNPQYGKKSERTLEIRQRRLSRKKRGSNNFKKVSQRVAKVHQRIARQRQDYQWKVAKQIVDKADVVVFEDLNIKGMKARCQPKWDEETQRYQRNAQAAKSQLNKAISDASWYSLKQKTKHQASKQGVLVVDINPRRTSQTCPQCGYCSPKNRDGEKFICENCGHHDDADVNASRNIAETAIKDLSQTQLRVVSPKVTPKPESTGCRKVEILTVPLDAVPGNPIQLDFLAELGWGTG